MVHGDAVDGQQRVVHWDRSEPFSTWCEKISAGPPTPIAAMSEAQYLDLVSQMHVLAAECARLTDVACGSLDARGDSGWVVHGPWLVGECVGLLREWLDAGLLALRRRSTATWEEAVLAPAEARALLADPASWDTATDDDVCIVMTEHGSRTAWESWFGSLARPPRW
ncbi:hypothetical protein AB6N23_13720 [Cellulomonas sp. 179-A 9B4 NHS]|uniref:hypothetical protein n=1 Tax=Cellulomonas sp. 179-A 9B4 NHS TaxID=3142379 RepID=UPI0039A3444F